MGARMVAESGGSWRGFYVIEGIDGAGKTTCMELLKERAKKEGREDIVFTHEPASFGRAALGLLEAGDCPPHPDTLAFVFAADRHEHLFGEGGIAESLKAGRKVICDRYLYSSIAYQGATADGWLAFRLNFVTGDFPLPEKVFWLDIGVDEALRRIAARGEGQQAMEKREILEKADEAYAMMMGGRTPVQRRKNIFRMDARLPPEKIAAAIWQECFG